MSEESEQVSQYRKLVDDDRGNKTGPAVVRGLLVFERFDLHQAGDTLVAQGPFLPWPTSNRTDCPSSRFA
jgi:hypothetical protein